MLSGMHFSRTHESIYETKMCYNVEFELDCTWLCYGFNRAMELWLHVSLVSLKWFDYKDWMMVMWFEFVYG